MQWEKSINMYILMAKVDQEFGIEPVYEAQLYMKV